MQDEESNEQADNNFYPLDEPAIAFFAQGLRQIEIVNAQMSGGLDLYMKQHNLSGRWQLAENRRELERVEPRQVLQP